ncbi:Ada Methylated DNA-protein cysteine methyltransferase [Burkholderiaceae bacterium]
MSHSAHLPRIVQTVRTSPLGAMLLAAAPQGLCGVWFVGQQHSPDNTPWHDDDTHPVLDAAHQQLQAYFDGQLQTFALPLQFMTGTPFQQTVWRALQNIPYGHTTTYGDIAQRIGKPQAVRAVGAAIGRNPWSVVVPCHRVVGANGALTGYAGGLDRKKHLLALEARMSSRIN